MTQIFQLNLPDDVSTLTNFIEPVQITDYPLDIDNLLVNNQATRLAFSCQVYYNRTINETAEDLDKAKKSGSLVYKFDKLFIRHWDQFMLGRRNHPFLVSIKRNDQGTFTFTSTPTDLLFLNDTDSPTRPFGSAKPQWSFSSSGNRFAFTRQHDETSAVAWSTNLDVYWVDLMNESHDVKCISCQNIAADTDPLFSPIDDDVIVYRAQAVPGYESDQFKLKLWNSKTSKKSISSFFHRNKDLFEINRISGETIVTLLDDWDRSVQAMTWSRDGNSLFLEIGEEGRNVIYQASGVMETTEPTVDRLLHTGSSHAVSIHPKIDNQFVFTHESLTEPANIYLFESITSFRPITTHNSNWTEKVIISKDVEIFTYPGALNESVSGWHMAPIGGRAQKAPLAFLIHGGPQNSWYDAWSYRWNFQAYAASGFGVLAINFHGSDSYGQNFTNSITGNYGTYPFEDLELGLDYAYRTYNYLDDRRSAALGASYGGYMINWIAGHPEMSQRFQTLVCHDGLFDLRGMAYSTEELWFSEHDVGNFTPYGNPEAFEKFNPVNHVANWTQPMLIIHGGHDYRVPDTQGISAFTALQRRGIESRLLYLPNENHWTLNPFNSLIWYDEVLGWITRFTTNS